ncbi:MAG TPA: DoxX family protein [Salinimicrobium sp.]|nr:DoxX family protein [Salinimicrobium sp.]
MKNTYPTNLTLPKVDLGLLVFRIAISGMMLTHGIPKLITLFGSGEIAFGDPIGLGSVTSFTLVLIAEFICAILVLVGLGTRLAVIPLIIDMTVAAFFYHLPEGFRTMEIPLLYLIGFGLLFFTGSGKYSLDYYFLSKDKKAV